MFWLRFPNKRIHSVNMLYPHIHLKKTSHKFKKNFKATSIVTDNYTDLKTE